MTDTKNDPAITPNYVRRGLALAGIGAKVGKITQFAEFNGARARTVEWSERAMVAVQPVYSADGDADARANNLASLLSVLPNWTLALCDQIDALRAELTKVRPKPIDVYRGSGCVRQDDRGNIWLLNHHESGWASFGVPLKDWDQLFRIYNIKIGAPQQDAAGTFWPVEPGKKGGV